MAGLDKVFRLFIMALETDFGDLFAIFEWPLD
jgi:hypothetical protein